VTVSGNEIKLTIHEEWIGTEIQFTAGPVEISWVGNAGNFSARTRYDGTLLDQSPLVASPSSEPAEELNVQKW
jgi:hypothetical protein